MRNGLLPGGFSTKTGRYAVFFTVVDPMNDAQGLRRPFALYHKQESRLTKILGSIFKIQFFGAIYSPLNKEEKRYAGKLKKTTCCAQSKFAM